MQPIFKMASLGMETKMCSGVELFIKPIIHLLFTIKAHAANREAMNKIETGIAKYPLKEGSRYTLVR